MGHPHHPAMLTTLEDDRHPVWMLLHLISARHGLGAFSENPRRAVAWPQYRLLIQRTRWATGERPPAATRASWSTLPPLPRLHDEEHRGRGARTRKETRGKSAPSLHYFWATQTARRPRAQRPRLVHPEKLLAGDLAARGEVVDVARGHLHGRRPLILPLPVNAISTTRRSPPSSTRRTSKRVSPKLSNISRKRSSQPRSPE